MRLMLFTDTLADVNGVARFVQDMAACASSANREFRIVTSTRNSIPPFANVVNISPAWSFPMPMYPMLKLAWPSHTAIARAVHEFLPDVVHISTPGPVGLAGRSLALRNNLPLAGTYHTDFPAYIERLSGDHVLGRGARAVMRWFYAPFDRVLARSEESTALIRDIGVPPTKVRTILAGVDLHRFGPRYADQDIWRHLGLQASSGILKILYCGRVSVEKNMPLLQAAWELVRATHSGRARLIIVGDGPALADMKRSLAGSDVCFTGFRHGKELSDLYASSDAFVFPSRTDTLGQAVLEALASGLPAIVSDAGGPARLVKHGETGLIVRGSEPQAWACAIRRLIDNAQERRAMGAQAAQLAQSCSITASFESFWNIHEELLAHQIQRTRPTSGTGRR